MNQCDILNLLNAKPFIPFRLHLTDGKTYDVLHPEFVWVFPNRLEIAWPMPGEAHLMQDSDYVGLLHIVRIEPLKQAA